MLLVTVVADKVGDPKLYHPDQSLESDEECFRELRMMEEWERQTEFMCDKTG